MNRFENQVVVVTGGSAGIGAATAKEFAKEGAKVVIVARRKEVLESTLAEIKALGAEALAISADVTDEAACIAAFEEIIAKFGQVDVLVNNAGVGDHHWSIEFTDDELWDKCVTVNETSVFLWSREALKYMMPRNSGAIVNVSSIGGKFAVAGAAYSASKAACLGLTYNMAIQFAGTGIRVNAVCPSGTDTEMMIPEGPDGADWHMREITGRRIAKLGGGLCPPEYVAKPILFLASDDSKYMNGQCLVINRGSQI